MKIQNKYNCQYLMTSQNKKVAYCEGYFDTEVFHDDPIMQQK